MVVSKVCFAVLAPKYLVGVDVDVIREPHCDLAACYRQPCGPDDVAGDRSGRIRIAKLRSSV